MPLLDHFRGVMRTECSWHSLHHAWAFTMANALNTLLPPGYRARPFALFGIEIDVATLRDLDQVWVDEQKRADALWQPTLPVATIPFKPKTDEFGVLIHYAGDSNELAAAIELVSTANKDRPETRDAFTTKCENYLRDGVGVVIIDIVTERRADLRAALLDRLEGGPHPTDPDPLSVVAYRPRDHQLDIWHEPLRIGGELPMMPLWLKTGPCVPLDLASTYQQARQGLGIGPEWDRITA